MLGASGHFHGRFLLIRRRWFSSRFRRATFALAASFGLFLTMRETHGFGFGVYVCTFE